MSKPKAWLTQEQEELLKASEIRDIKKEQETYGMFSAYFLVIAFFATLSVIAMILWFGKLTIFITSGFVLLEVTFLFLSYVQFKSYKSAVFKAKKRIEETQ